MRTSRKKELIKEQNKSVLMMACVCLAVIGIVGAFMIISSGSSSDNSEVNSSSISEDGIVNDIEVMKNR